MNLQETLPLRWWTPERWAAGVLDHPLELLNDHAHLERKAAVNAMALITHWPDNEVPQEWSVRLTAVARDEAEHLQRVTRILLRRGGQLSNNHRNPYASDLRRLVRLGEGWRDIVDRLMVAALIEARSCERFLLLAEGSEDVELASMFQGLWASEQGHYVSFLQMAEELHDRDQVAERWDWMLDQEARIIESQPPGPRIHSGL